MSTLESLVGVVASVDDRDAGGETATAHTAGVMVLALRDAADFSETGGMVHVAGNVLAYAAADLATDTLTLTQPLPVDVEADLPVTVWPHSPSRVASVMVEDRAEALTVHVPQSLLDQVPTGLRDPELAETVTVQLVDGAWTMRDVVAQPDSTVKEGAFRLGDTDRGDAGGIHEDGSGDFTEVRTARLVLDGTPLPDLVARRVESLGSDRTPIDVTYGPYGVDMPLWEATVDVPAGHTLTLAARGWVRGTPGGLGLLRCSYTASTDGTLPPRPTGASTELPPYAPIPLGATWVPAQWSWEFGAGVDAKVRLLVWLGMEGASDEVSARNFVFTPTMAKVRHAAGFAGVVRAQPGPQSTGGDTTPPPSLVPRTRTFDLAPHAPWVIAPGNPSPYHAVSGYRLQDVQVGRSASGYLWEALLALPSEALSFIASAEELVSARLALSASEALTAHVRPSIGTSTSAAITTNTARSGVRNIDPGSRTYTPTEPSGWTDLGARTLTALKVGDPALFVTYPSTTSPVGRFHGPSASASLRPRLEVTVRSRT